jgi:hypothetical protein
MDQPTNPSPHTDGALEVSRIRPVGVRSQAWHYVVVCPPADRGADRGSDRVGDESEDRGQQQKKCCHSIDIGALRDELQGNVRFSSAYTVLVGQHRICTVSFTDSEGISHDVTAATLYEAAVFAAAEFRRVGLFEVHIGPGTWLRGR